MDDRNDDADAHVGRLRAYYEDTWFDYRFLWLDPRTRAMHFGYQGEQRTSHDDSLLTLNEVMADRAGIEAGSRVLDAGCGVGGSSLWLAEQRDAEVVGVNLVEDHVERARRYVQERGTQGATFERRDYTDTGFEAGSFDVVWALESACHAPEKPPLAAEAWRLLRPGGRLVMAEYVLEPGDPGPDIVSWEHSWEMTLASADTWQRTLADAGFADIEITDVTPNMRRSIKRLKRLCLGLRPIARVLHTARIRTAAQQRNIRGSLDMWRALENGRWFYAITSATKRQPGVD